MDFTQFGTNVIENIVAAMPQLIVVVSTLTYSLRSIKSRTDNSLSTIQNKTETFPIILEETKGKIDEALLNSQKEISDFFDATRENFDNRFISFSKNIQDNLQLTTEAISKNVNSSLLSMQNELANYQRELTQSKEKLSLLVKENKLFIDVILQFVADNPDLVAKGITQIVSTKANMTKKEIESYPKALIEDMDLLQKTLTEVKSVAGQKTLDKLLGGLGYERK